MRVLLFLLLLAAPPAFATIAQGTPKFAWVPSNVTSGTPKEYRLHCGIGTAAKVDMAVIPAPASGYQAPIGQFAWKTTYTCSVQIKLVEGNGSVESNDVTVPMPAQPVTDPPAPTNLTVQ